MGMFSELRGVFAARLETRLGEQLAQEMETTIKNLSNANHDVRHAAIEIFLKKRSELLAQKSTWTRERQVEIGRELRNTSKKKHRNSRNANDETESYGLWLAGAWLESGAIWSDQAQIAHLVLEQMIKD